MAESGKGRRVNQDVLAEMRRLRRAGYTIGDIADKVSRSERTVRRYVQDVETEVRARPNFGVTELMDWFYEQIVVRRRAVIAAILSEWGESFEFGVDTVDETTRALRAHVRALDKITVKRITADESYRREFFEEFMAPVTHGWMVSLRSEWSVRRVRRLLAPDASEYGGNGRAP